MENNNLPRPTQADYDRLLQLEDSKSYGDTHMELFNSFDWSAQIFEENGKYGLKSAVGEVLLPARFEDFMIMTGDVLRKGNRIVTQQNGQWGVMIADGTGSWLIEPQYDYIGYPQYLTPVCKDGKWGVLDISTGQYLIPPECDRLEHSRGLLFVNGLSWYEKAGKIGIIRLDGVFTEALFEDTEFEPEGPVKVKFNGEWGFINEKGNFTTDEEDDLWYFHVD